MRAAVRLIAENGVAGAPLKAIHIAAGHIVCGIVEDEHRGSIGYSRSPLGGARFTIRLPI